MATLITKSAAQYETPIQTKNNPIRDCLVEALNMREQGPTDTVDEKEPKPKPNLAHEFAATITTTAKTIHYFPQR
jgi:hypothetical protein